MEIKPASAYRAISFNANSSQQRQMIADPMTNSAASATKLADTITVSQAARDRAAEETKGGNNYDFSNISPNDILGTINNLIKNGKMSLDESSALLPFIPNKILHSSASVNSDQPINLFSGLERMIAYNKSIHNDAAVIYAQKAFAALERLQGTGD